MSALFNHIETPRSARTLLRIRQQLNPAIEDCAYAPSAQSTPTHTYLQCHCDVSGETDSVGVLEMVSMRATIFEQAEHPELVQMLADDGWEVVCGECDGEGRLLCVSVDPVITGSGWGDAHEDWYTKGCPHCGGQGRL